MQIKIGEASVCAYVSVHQTARDYGITFAEKAHIYTQRPSNENVSTSQTVVNNLFLKNKFPLSRRGAESECGLASEV